MVEIIYINIFHFISFYFILLFLNSDIDSFSYYYLAALLISYFEFQITII